MQQKRVSVGSSDDIYTPIKHLNTYTMDWKIKARVTKKHEKKTLPRNGSELIILNIDLMDKEGSQIQATFFNEAAERFNGMISEDHVYLFSGGVLKVANKKFTSIKNEYSLTFDQNSEIIEVNDDDNIKREAFSFSTLAQIKTMPN